MRPRRSTTGSRPKPPELSELLGAVFVGASDEAPDGTLVAPRTAELPDGEAAIEGAMEAPVDAAADAPTMALADARADAAAL